MCLFQPESTPAGSSSSVREHFNTLYTLVQNIFSCCLSKEIILVLCSLDLSLGLDATNVVSEVQILFLLPLRPMLQC